MTTPQRQTRLSNFEAACLSTMSGLKSIDLEIEHLEGRRAKMRKDLREALLTSDSQVAEFEGIGKASIVAGRQAVETVDIDAVPSRFLKTVVDVAAAAKALKAGGHVPGVRLGEEGEASLRCVWAK